MAHSYSSNPFSTGTPSYAPQQPYYPIPHNGTQQPIHTPPSLTQQSSQSVAYQHQPVTNTSRFESNSQPMGPAPTFNPFHPPPIPPSTLSADFFKQFANAGLPPPPPPSFPPVPIPNTTGFPRFSAQPTASSSSPYTPQPVPASHSFASGVNLVEQSRHTQQEPSSGRQMGKDGRDLRHLNEHTSRSHNTNRGGNAQAARAVLREDDDKDQSLPSFGSRSDLELLFANLQNQVPQEVDAHLANSMSIGGYAGANRQPSEEPGDVSPYDPTRPATIDDRAMGSFRGRVDKSQAQAQKPMQRKYDDKPVPELRQLAKGALLSLVPHKILYPELVKEGIHPQVLRELYAELGIKVDLDQVQSTRKEAAEPTRTVMPHSNAPGSLLDQQNVQNPSDDSSSGAPSGEVFHNTTVTEKQQAAPTPSMERKDRIAQLLAAKAGRPSPSTPSAGSPAQRQEALPAVPPANVLETSNASPSAPHSPQSQQETRAVSQAQISKAKAQTELVRAKMEQLKKEAQAKSTAVGQPLFGTTSQLRSSITHSSLIPGLFMTPAGSASDEANTQADNRMSVMSSEERPAASPNPLKRSLSSDPSATSTEPLMKRIQVEDPDEQSEGEIIEDESDAMAMDSESGSAEVRNQKPPQSLPAAVEEIAAAHPSRSDSAVEAGNDDLYRIKQTEIEAMRRRIAELEQRNKLKRSKSEVESPASSNPSTPVMTRAGNPLSSPPTSQSLAVSGVAVTSKQPRSITKLTPAQLAERAAALKADLLKQRAARQKVLQEGLPDLNLEVSKTELRIKKVRADLSQARSNVESYRTALEQSTNLEKELAEELHRLETQLQEGRTGQKQYFDELQQIKMEKLAEAQGGGPSKVVETISETQPATDASPFPTPASRHVEQPAVEGDSDPTAFDQRLPEDATSKTLSMVDRVEAANVSGSPEDVLNDEQPVKAVMVPEQEPEDTQGEQILTRADTLQTQEMEISPEPDSVPEQSSSGDMDSGEVTEEDTAMDMGEDSDGSASMSDSEREDEEYEPAAAEDPGSFPQSMESDEYDPEEAPVTDATPTTNQFENETDFYEPYEHAEDVDDPVNAEFTEPMATDLAPEPTPATGTLSEVRAENDHDDIESGPQLTEANALVNKEHFSNSENRAEEMAVLDGGAETISRFVPYKTPLSNFKDFRFHADYKDSVKTGYKSLTYFNNIDPSRPICPTELSGETCTDPSCEEQHLHQIGLSENAILSEMSSGSNMDKATKDQFFTGLKEVIADLRARDIKEFDGVANALSEYRRKFFAVRDGRDIEHTGSG
ncbi:hypothetical protein PV08_04255 [Exophiala spinifera]|uniref:Putative zinc-finger domain-containing protein n=1 Tax=Exophiala spinifera TaxID=91928 RepID=A0A0D2C0D9_9EURO|nr:uncharacterized protein PV08_04255 [Exophiala spinifera]KIW17064.1 hypothetical protein PV08_04255 [Exophiala spinifera]